MKQRLFLSGLFIIVLPVFLFAQNDTMRLSKNYLLKYWTDTKEIVRSPLRWDQKDWQRVGAFAATTGALFFADQSLHDWVQDQRSNSLNDISRIGLEPFGAKYTLAVCGALYGYGLLAKNRKSESTALLAVESFALASIFVRIPKSLVGRARPDSGNDVSSFDFNGPFGGTSFPSGHTIAVFSAATVIANQYRETVWVPVVSYSIAGLAGLARVYENRHWVSDVFAGAVLGIAIGNLVCPVTKKSNFTVIPVKMGPAYGFHLAYSL